jgi:hypothetical protein
LQVGSRPIRTPRSGVITWDKFERAIFEYRDAEYSGRSPISGESAYLVIFDELADVPLADRGSHVDSLVLFLNRWACHFPIRTPNTRIALREWITRESKSLQALADVTLSHAQLPAYREESERLYASLIDLQSPHEGPSIPTMGPAAASKILHLMVPPLFVMWDAKIKKGGWEYGDFLLRMHGLAVRIRDELAPEEARDDIDGYLQRTLGYPVRKPLAKYIDEYNCGSPGEAGVPTTEKRVPREASKAHLDRDKAARLTARLGLVPRSRARSLRRQLRSSTLVKAWLRATGGTSEPG